MLVSLTPAQKIVVALTVVAIIAGLWIGANAGDSPPANTTQEQAEVYGLPEASQVPVMVHVVGEVRRPGLYTLPAESRVRDAVEAAGGFTGRASASSVNLAAYLEDGDQVTVEADSGAEPQRNTSQPARVVEAPDQSQPPAPSASSVQQTSPAVSRQPSSPAPAPTNASTELPDFARRPSQTRPRLNSGGLDELQQIPGVGPKLAKQIIYHRSVNGRFTSYSDLDDVPGIGPATIEKIRVSATLR